MSAFGIFGRDVIRTRRDDRPTFVAARRALVAVTLGTVRAQLSTDVGIYEVNLGTSKANLRALRELRRVYPEMNHLP